VIAIANTWSSSPVPRDRRRPALRCSHSRPVVLVFLLLRNGAFWPSRRPDPASQAARPDRHFIDSWNWADCLPPAAGPATNVTFSVFLHSRIMKILPVPSGNYKL
jgi:hypothetical protein